MLAGIYSHDGYFSDSEQFFSDGSQGGVILTLIVAGVGLYGNSKLNPFADASDAFLADVGAGVNMLNLIAVLAIKGGTSKRDKWDPEAFGYALVAVNLSSVRGGVEVPRYVL